MAMVEETPVGGTGVREQTLAEGTVREELLVVSMVEMTEAGMVAAVASMEESLVEGMGMVEMEVWGYSAVGTEAEGRSIVGMEMGAYSIMGMEMGGSTVATLWEELTASSVEGIRADSILRAETWT